jgi:hypothetical protein
MSSRVRIGRDPTEAHGSPVSKKLDRITIVIQTLRKDSARARGMAPEQEGAAPEPAAQVHDREHTAPANSAPTISSRWRF